MPAAFRDKTGRTWALELNAPLIRKIQQTLGVNLVDLKADPIGQIETDPLLFVDVLWMIVEADAGDVTDEEFGRALAGEAVIDAAGEAMAEAIVNFSPSGKRSLIRSLREQNRKVQDQASSLTLAKAAAKGERIAEAIATKAMTEVDQMIANLERTSLLPGEASRSPQSSTGLT